MSKPLSAVDCVGPAFAQTKRQLFAPFRLQRWVRLALVCLITGEFAGGGGGGFSGNFNFPHSRTKGGHGLLAHPHIDWGKLLPWLPWIIAGVVLVFLIILLWIYIASVFRFVLFDSVLYDRCELKGSWGRWEPRGRSYFYWCLAIFVVFLAAYSLLIGVPLLLAWRAGLFHHPGEHLVPLILGGAGLFFLLLAFFVLGAIVALFAKDFCVPIMAMENVGVLDAWRRLLPMLAAEKMAIHRLCADENCFGHGKRHHFRHHYASRPAYPAHSSGDRWGHRLFWRQSGGAHLQRRHDQHPGCHGWHHPGGHYLSDCADQHPAHGLLPILRAPLSWLPLPGAGRSSLPPAAGNSASPCP